MWSRSKELFGVVSVVLFLPGIRGMAGTNASSAYSAVFVTTPNEEVAKKLAHGLVNKRMAACVNIIPKITSVYMWEGKVNEDTEVLMMIKTKTSRVEDLTSFVKENHPYDVCEVIALPIEKGNAPYLDWINDTVTEK
ncbi:protein CutA homolog [Schistocerca nitens]|uniref:protein CutA homolog n=1 Tax=Schistocerca nitens TaxID=7011 RepID=UPI002118792C|nr:protein CutA homolog [Schistocerca nitens]